MNEKKVLIRKPFLITAAVLAVLVLFLVWLVFCSGFSEYMETTSMSDAKKAVQTWDSTGDTPGYDKKVFYHGLTFMVPQDFTIYGADLYGNEDRELINIHEPYDQREDYGDTFTEIIGDADRFSRDKGGEKVDSVYDLHRFVYELSPYDSPKFGRDARKYRLFAELKSGLVAGNNVYRFQTDDAKGFIKMRKDGERYIAEIELFPDIAPDIYYSAKVCANDEEKVKAIVGSAQIDISNLDLST